MNTHHHDFGATPWPFAEPVDVAAFTTRFVLDRTLPILLVTHDDDDGAWQILCGTTDDPEDGRIACLGCLLQLDPTIASIADLPAGWSASRKTSDSPWVRHRPATP